LVPAATLVAHLGINCDNMVGVSVNAVLRSHAQILENMAAKVEELARRAADLQEAKRLQHLSKTYRLLALQHQDWFDPGEKSNRQSA
jgi:uncharacterized membrane protein YgaE (UPF0421/DUF939 family)